jgi:hypothetical protein
VKEPPCEPVRCDRSRPGRPRLQDRHRHGPGRPNRAHPRQPRDRRLGRWVYRSMMESIAANSPLP